MPMTFEISLRFFLFYTLVHPYIRDMDEEFKVTFTNFVYLEAIFVIFSSFTLIGTEEFLIESLNFIHMCIHVMFIYI